jgi:hypothetical protein
MVRFRLSTLLIVVGLIAAVTAYSVHRYRLASAALTSLTVNRRGYADGRDVSIRIAGNPLGESKVVVIEDADTSDPAKRAARLPIDLRLRYGAYLSESGLWIDGRRQPMGDGLHVVYATDGRAAEIVEIANDKQQAFLAEAATLDPRAVVKKWVEPNRRVTKQSTPKT